MADPDYRYRWAALDGGGFGVFVEHYRGEHRGWWRLVAQFGEQVRAESYAEIENVLLDDGSAPRYSDEKIAAEMPRLPASGVTVERLSETDILLSAAPATPPDDRPPDEDAEEAVPALSEPLSDIPCARCQTLLPLSRAKHPKARYCSNECSAAATKERIEANRKVPVDPELCLGCGARLPAMRWRGFQYCNQDCLDRHARTIGAAPDIAVAQETESEPAPIAVPIAVAAPPALKQEPAPFRAPVRPAQPQPSGFSMLGGKAAVIEAKPWKRLDM